MFNELIIALGIPSLLLLKSQSLSDDKIKVRPLRPREARRLASLRSRT